MAPTTPEVILGHTVAMRYQYRLVELMNEVYRRLEHSERRGGRRRGFPPMLWSCRQLGVTPLAPTTPEVFHGHTAAMWYHDRLIELMK